MRVKHLLIALIGLTVAALACRVPGTPTVAPNAMGTAVAQTVAAELTQEKASQVEPTETLSPSPEPMATATNAPTSTARPPTDTPRPSTATPTATPFPCAIAIASAFAPRFSAHPEIFAALGCPVGEPKELWVAEQRFQGGRMFWRQDTESIYILYETANEFRVEPDEFSEGDPADACPEVGSAPEGLTKPVRGFNWHWCNTPGVRDVLGWGLAEEAGYTTVWQRFEQGFALQSLTGHIFIFYDGGTWEYIE